MKAAPLILAAGLMFTGAAIAQQDAFPHRAHARLFPLCDACHAGIPTGSTADAFPAPSQCASCHDGVRERRVSWAGPRKHVSNLVFSHPDHARSAQAAGDSLDCLGCHGSAGREWMAVSRADPDACRSCHAHEALSHFAGSRDCSVCHLPLTRTAFDTPTIAALEKPATHQSGGFISDHAPRTASEQTGCATCHARESCLRCHMDATLPAIASLATDSRIAALVRGTAPDYPAPQTHRESSWRAAHGTAARAGISTCGTCHTRSSCIGCHRDRQPDVLAALPTPASGDPRGVRLQASATRVHRADVRRAHGTEAATLEASCNACHAASFCESCHTAPASPAFHPVNFLARHAPEAYAADTDCSSCHNAELFCRACHQGQGMVSKGRLGVAFHTANPFWIVGHGAAARQGMEGCVSCHTQSSCTQCHSAITGWRISPHGPGFDPTRVQRADPVQCRLCHPQGGTQ